MGHMFLHVLAELGGTAIIRWSTRDGSTPPGFPDRKSYAFFGVEPYLEKEEVRSATGQYS